MAKEDLQWLTRPPAPGEVHLHVGAGEGAKITPEIQEALDNLVRAVQAQPEVQGFGGPSGAQSLKLTQGMYLKFESPGTMSYKFQTSSLKLTDMKVVKYQDKSSS